MAKRQSRRAPVQVRISSDIARVFAARDSQRYGRPVTPEIQAASDRRLHRVAVTDQFARKSGSKQSKSDLASVKDRVRAAGQTAQQIQVSQAAPGGIQERAKRYMEAPPSRALTAPAVPGGMDIPAAKDPSERPIPKGAPMSPAEQKYLRDSQRKSEKLRQGTKDDPLRHIEPMVIDDYTRLWTT